MSTREFSVAAILVAAGKGSRFVTKEKATPKQFLLLGNKPVYFWSLHPLVQHPLISQVILVIPQELESNIKDELASLFNDQDGTAGIRINNTTHAQASSQGDGHRPYSSKDTVSVTSRQALAKISLCWGGETRQESVLRGLEYLNGTTSNGSDFILIHDACRPFLTADIIESVIKHVTTSGACTVATPVSDTIKKVRNGIVLDTLPRQELQAVQTPQAASYSDLLKAHRRAVRENFATTDDAALLEWAGFKVNTISGNPYNLKITQPLDLIICEALAAYLLENL